MDNFVVQKIPHTYKLFFNYTYLFLVLTYLIYMIYDILYNKENLALSIIPIVYYIILILYVSIMSMKKFKNSLVGSFSFFNHLIGTGFVVDPDNSTKVQRVFISHNELYVLATTWFIAVIFLKIMLS